MRLTIVALRPSISKLLDHYGNFHPSVLTIQHFIDFGKNRNSAAASFLFLRKEIPVRLANILKEINHLPEPLQKTCSFQKVLGWYEQSFVDLLEFENADSKDKEIVNRFADVLDKIQSRHTTVVETMAGGVSEMKESLEGGRHSTHLNDRMQYFLDRFYLSRIGIRLLIHQHLLLFAEAERTTRHIGCFDPVCNIKTIALDAYDNARFLCEQYYDRSPKCLINSLSPYDDEDDEPVGKDVVMTYIPYHLYYMLFELFKNALRAVVEFHLDSETLPPIKMIICKGREDVTIRLSDEGGGVPRTELDKLMQYMYTTAPQPPSATATTTTPLAGYGYGLPISRLYAKYFHGDLWLNSVDGYGTDATIFLKVLPREAVELLPVYNKTSSHRYRAAEQIPDWSCDPSTHF